ncbi:MAG: DUF6285 domain-containing protein [Rhodospirillaceae bacterium]
MHDRPAALELLAAARDTVADTLVPALPEEQRYAARLVAAAIATALRELAAGDAAASAERRALAALYGDDPAADRRLAADIRAGAFDPPSERRDAVLALLRADVDARLSVSNPGYAR